MSTTITAGNATNNGASIASDTAGTIEIKTGSTPTTAITVDTSQNVGIGTSSPNNYGGSFKTLQVTGGSTSYGGILRLTNSDSSRVGHVGVDSSTMFINTATSTPITFGIADSEKMRIDTSGNVGIGTSSPTAPLDSVSNSSAIGLRIRGRSSDNFSLINFVGNNPVNDYAYIGSPVANALAFYTNGFNERMRIDSSGNLLVNATSTIGATAGWIQVKYAGSSKNGIALQTTDSTGYAVTVYNSSSALVGSVYYNGSSTAFNTSSDYRLKENIAPMTGALDVVQQLKPVTYNWKTDGSSGQGFIAHELQEVVPDCVTGEKDAVDADGNPQYQGIDTSFLVATLTAAIQEQQAMIEELKIKVATLEAK